MAEFTEAQRKWLEVLGVDTTALRPPGAAPAADADAAPPEAEAAPQEADAAPSPDAPVAMAGPRKAPFLDLNSPEMRDALMKGITEQARKDKLDAEKTLARMDKTLKDIEAYVAGLPREQVIRSSYAAIITDVRKRFPEAAGLSQWVKETSGKVPELRGKLPSPTALMGVVEKTLKANGAELGWSMSTGKNLATVASDRLLAAYMSELPAGVSVAINGGVVQLTVEGAALTVATPASDVDAKAGKGGTSVALKHNDYTIQVENSGWTEFDPELRGEWKKIEADAKTLATLKADGKQAEFDLAWTNLQERVTAHAKASEKKIAASVAYLKKDANDQDAFKAGLDAEVDLEAMQGKLKAYAANPTIEAVLEVTAAADKVSARLELKAVKTGSVVTARFEKALDETKVAIEALLRDGDTTVAAELKKKADDLSAKIKVVHKTKDLKLAAELEKTLTDVRGSVELAVTKGRTTVKGGATASSSGEAGGKVQIDIALKDGRTFVSEGDKLSFAADVSTKGYKFEVAFSMGEPVDTASLQDLFADADRQIKELYKLAGDKGVRSIDDAKALNAKLQEVMAPVKASADKAKTLKKKTDIAAAFGFSLQGDWPAGGKAAPPAGVFNVKLMF